jgi:hypothetical protein
MPFFILTIRSKLFPDDTKLMFISDNIEDVRGKCIDGIGSLHTI